MSKLVWILWAACTVSPERVSIPKVVSSVAELAVTTEPSGFRIVGTLAATSGEI
jgi:hypothetical protein